MEKARSRYGGEFRDGSIGPVKKIRRFWALYREAFGIKRHKQKTLEKNHSQLS